MKAERATVMQLLPQGSNANSHASSRASSRILTKRSFPAFSRERRHCFAHTRKKWRRNTENKERPSMTDFTCRVQPIPDAETDWVHSTCRIQVNKKMCICMPGTSFVHVPGIINISHGLWVSFFILFCSSSIVQ